MQLSISLTRDIYLTCLGLGVFLNIEISIQKRGTHHAEGQQDTLEESGRFEHGLVESLVEVVVESLVVRDVIPHTWQQN